MSIGAIEHDPISDFRGLFLIYKVWRVSGIAGLSPSQDLSVTFSSHLELPQIFRLLLSRDGRIWAICVPSTSLLGLARADWATHWQESGAGKPRPNIRRVRGNESRRSLGTVHSTLVLRSSWPLRAYVHACSIPGIRVSRTYRLNLNPDSRAKIFVPCRACATFCQMPPCPISPSLV